MRRPLLIGAALLLAGCRLDIEPHHGTDAADVDRDAGGDAPRDAADTAGETGDAALDVGHAKQRCVAVTTTEFRADGGLSIVDANTFVAQTDVTAIHSDANVQELDGRVFVINRQGGDSLQEVDPRDGYRTVFQRSVGRGSNPWTVAPLGDGTAWVSLYNDGALQRVDLDADTDDGFLLGDPVPLPTDADPDDKVEPLVAHVHEGVLYVLVQGFADYPSCDGGRAALYAFDPRSLVPTQAFDGGGSAHLTLAACNPVDAVFTDDGRLIVAHSGNYRVRTDAPTDDGGVEVIDLATGDSAGLLVTEAALGERDIAAMASDGERVWLALAAGDFSAEVVPLDLASGAIGEAAWSSDVGGIFGLELWDDQLWVVDRSEGEAGLVVLDADTGAHVAGPIGTGYPPFDIAFFEVDGGC